MKLISIILLSIISLNANSQAVYKGFAAKKYVVPNILPVANAGTDKSITLPTNSTTLSGSGTDADGTIPTYAWTKLSGPVTGTITSPSSASTALASLTAGTYIFTLTITDNSGGTATDNVIVTVSPAANISPVANAGTDQAITLPTNNTTLSGSGTDADGTISTYAWVKLSGPASFIIVNPSSATTAINSLAAGVYQFQLTVTDNNGATNTDAVQVTVNAAPANIPPTANAGANQTITLPTSTVTLTGSGTDADGTISSYSWTKLSGPAGGTITSSSNATTGITSLQAGIYQYQLTVTDNSGATGTNTTTITVNSAANIPPVANAGVNQTITLPTSTVTLSGTGTDADGTIASYEWVKLSGPAGGTITSASSATTGITALQAGVYQFQLTVTDNSGVTNSDGVQVTVNAAPANIAPVANAGANQTITLPTSTATLTGSGSDADGTVTGYAWTKLSGPAGGTITSPSSASTGITSLQAGIYQFQLTVTDNLGLTGSNTTTVTVNSAANIAPISNAGPDKARTLPADTATLFGTGIDTDGNITTYSWTKLVGSPSGGVIVSPSSATTLITGLIVGTYQYQLAVTDNSGAVNLDVMIINVAANPAPPAANGAFSYTISGTKHVSIGVFKNDSILVKTIVSDTIVNAGTHTRNWDGTDDYGNAIPSPDATYKIKVLSNNVGYAWQGTIGNTSDNMTGSTKHRGYNNAMVGMALGTTFGYYSTGYSEATSSMKKFNLSTPQQAIPLFNAHSLTGDVRYVVTDGTKVYWGLMDGFSYNNSMVMATYTSDDTQVPFSSGQFYHFAFGNSNSNFNYVISKVDATNSEITGMAVQQTGNYLFVARGGYAIGSLQVINKTTGAFVRTLSFIGCKGLSIDPTNDNLWVLQGTTATKYGVNGDGTLTAAITTISSLINPLATQVSPNGTLVAICDAGTSQQVKFFNNSTGAATNTLGTAGGYVSDASVTDYKFYFSDVLGNRIPFVTFKADSSFWVNDPGNQRTQLYTASRVYSTRISFIGGVYNTWADKNNINKVFVGYHEFAIDYSVQTLTGSTGWTLTKNWGANVTSAYDGFTKVRFQTTLSNGKTYGIMNINYQQELVELPSTGQLRFTGVILSNTKFFCSDGSLQDYTAVNEAYTYLRYALTGFDGSNNPTWSATAETLATGIRDIVIGNPIGAPASQIFSNSTNKLAMFNNGTNINFITDPITGYHLAVMSRGANNTFLSQTEKSTHRNYSGPYPKAGWYDVGNDVNAYSGSLVNIIDRYIITAYHGEFWKASQTNKYNIYYDNGLALGQFGTTRPDVGFGNLAAFGMAGNALYPVVVKDGAGDLYLYHGDESDHSGVHRWKVTGLNTISEQVITMPYPSSYTAPILPYTDLMAGLPFNTTLVNNTAGWTRNPTTETSAWKINASKLTYDFPKENDLLIQFDPAGASTNTFSKSLGSNSGLSDWTVSGGVYFGTSSVYNTSPVSINFRVLDAAGKVLSDLYVQQSGTYPNYTTAVKGNTANIYSVTEVLSPTVDVLISKIQPFSITYNAGSVTFSYANLTPVATTIMDATGTAGNPTTLQVTATHDGSAYPIYGRTIDLSNLKFYKNTL